ncbi:GIY-YIG nuclease family protein [Leptolyngbya sp. PL-A3]|uniref:GIY-YIG nuclease family protein n=1 Tax=Leptolyngbya sp. PL-A3 TaxID=2933911 RepID=UPI003297964A
MLPHPEFNLLTLPSRLLSQRDQLPACPAIYFALDSKDRILYIGRAINLVERWRDHHRLEQLTRIGKRSPVRLAWLDCSGQAQQLGVREAHYINLYNPLLNNTPVPPKKITPSEIALQDALSKISRYCIIFGMTSKSPHHDLPTINIRYFGGGRVPSTLRRIFKASNKRPTRLHWAEFVRRKGASWWRARCNGIAIEVGPWFSFGEEDQHFAEDLNIQPLAGVEMLALQTSQLVALIEKHPFLHENYPGMAALEADPIRLIWTRTDQPNPFKLVKPSSLESSFHIAGETMSQESEQVQEDILDEVTPRKMERQFLTIEGVEVEVCSDCSTGRKFIRHHLAWRMLFNERNPDFERANVIGNLKIYTNHRLSTVRWTGFDFKIERVAFIDDDMETDVVLLPLALFEDMIRYEYNQRKTHQQDQDCVKLGGWLEKNAIAQLLQNPV